MGTKGTIKFIFNGKHITLYCQYDSYLSGLGTKLINELIELLKEYTIEEIINKLDNVKVVYDINHESYYEPNNDEIKKLEKYTDLTVSHQSTKDWYCLLRKCQGSIIDTLDAGYAFYQCNKDMYNYVIDLDNLKFTCVDYFEQIRWLADLKINDLKSLIGTDMYAVSDSDYDNE